MILKLNESKNNLQLIQLENGFVVVDLVAEKKIDDYYLDLDANVIYNLVSRPNGKACKIIFASQSLNLEEVEIIDENNIFSKELNKIIDEESEIVYNRTGSLTSMEIFKKGVSLGLTYRQNTFTLEQLKEVIELARNEEYDHKNRGHYTYLEKQIIELVSQPSVEITFDKDSYPLSCKLL